MPSRFTPLHKIRYDIVSRGKFNDIIAQVRFSSEYLWSQAWCGDALYKAHTFLMSIFGEFIHLQLSEVHLCADVVGYDFSQCNYETQFVTRVRKNEAIYGADSVSLDCHRVSMLAFSKHKAQYCSNKKNEDELGGLNRKTGCRGAMHCAPTSMPFAFQYFSSHSPYLNCIEHKAPISCGIYNKTLEIKQKSGKTWFYDLWRKHGWDETSDVWRVEFRFKREFLHQVGIEWAYDVLDEMKRLWEYAAGHVEGGDDGLPDGWLRYVLPNEDSNHSRWPVHSAWSVVQGAFTDDVDPGLGPLVRERIREKNVERGIAATIGYISTLATWLGGEYVDQDADVSLMLHWLSEAGPEYLESKQRDFLQEVRKKQKRYGSQETEVAS
jgi:hypothetical protein